MTQILKNNRFLPVIIISLFLFQALYFAINVADGVYPDEGHHTILSILYKNSIGILSDSEETYRFGQISRQPFLYHWSMGKILLLNGEYFHERTLIRIVGAFISLISVLAAYSIATEFTKDRRVKLLSLFILANTLMFVFMSGSMNYDIFAILFSNLLILSFIKFIKYRSINQLLFCLLFSSLGLLSKISLFPLVLIIGFIVIFTLIIDWKFCYLQIRSIKFPTIILFLISFSFFSLAFSFYGSNILKYRELIPSCQNVLSHEKCLNSAQYARDVNEETLNSRNERMNIFGYAGTWFFVMSRGIYGVAGHVAIVRSLISIIPYALFLIAGFLATIRFIEIRRSTETYLALTAGFYTIFLLLFVNYPAYLKLGNIDIGVHGRYLFPVYFIILLLFTKNLFKLLNSRSELVKNIVTVVIALWFLYGGFGYFYRYAGKDMVRNCDFVVSLPRCG